MKRMKNRKKVSRTEIKNDSHYWAAQTEMESSGRTRREHTLQLRWMYMCTSFFRALPHHSSTKRLSVYTRWQPCKTSTPIKDDVKTCTLVSDGVKHLWSSSTSLHIHASMQQGYTSAIVGVYAEHVRLLETILNFYHVQKHICRISWEYLQRRRFPVPPNTAELHHLMTDDVRQYVHMIIE